MVRFQGSGVISISALLVSSALFTPLSITRAQTAFPSEYGIQIIYPPTEDRGAPERTKGSGSRGCGDYIASDHPTKLAALMPMNNISTTIDAQPSIYLYVPVTKRSQAEFTLYDWTSQNRTPIYQAQLSLTETAGIVKLTLPKQVQLQSDYTYAWNFSIYCSNNPQEAYQYVDGWLQPMSLSTEQLTKREQLRQQPLALAQFYAQAGIWADVLDILSHIRYANPQLWQGFLDSVELGHLAQYSVVNASQLATVDSSKDFIEN